MRAARSCLLWGGHRQAAAPGATSALRVGGTLYMEVGANTTRRSPVLAGVFSRDGGSVVGPTVAESWAAEKHIGSTAACVHLWSQWRHELRYVLALVLSCVTLLALPMQELYSVQPATTAFGIATADATAAKGLATPSSILQLGAPRGHQHREMQHMVPCLGCR